MLINGIDHNLDDDNQSSLIEKEKIFAHYFPDATVKSFDSWRQGDLIDEFYLYRKAEHVLDQLGKLRVDYFEVRSCILMMDNKLTYIQGTIIFHFHRS